MAGRGKVASSGVKSCAAQVQDPCLWGHLACTSDVHDVDHIFALMKGTKASTKASTKESTKESAMRYGSLATLAAFTLALTARAGPTRQPTADGPRPDPIPGS